MYVAALSGRATSSLTGLALLADQGQGECDVVLHAVPDDRRAAQAEVVCAVHAQEDAGGNDRGKPAPHEPHQKLRAPVLLLLPQVPQPEDYSTLAGDRGWRSPVGSSLYVLAAFAKVEEALCSNVCCGHQIIKLRHLGK